MPPSSDRGGSRGDAAERAMAIRALITLAFVAYVGGQFARAGTTRTEAAVLYVAILLASIVIHELAHALVGRLVGAEVTGMRLGFGPRLTPAGSWLDLRPIVVAAHVTYIPPRGARRSQLFAIGVAGIVVHGVLIVVALAIGTDAVWVRELLLANIVALVSNAIPFSGGFTSTAGGPNDGQQLLGLLRHRGSFLRASDPDVQAAAQAYDLGGPAAAQTLLDSLDRPDAGHVRLLLVRALLDAGRYQDATALAPGSADPDRPWAADDLTARAAALAALTAATPGAYPLLDAEHGAERAMAAVPQAADAGDRAAVALSLGLVRLAQGRHEEAQRILGWAAAGVADGERGLLLAAAGLAELGVGQRSAAETLLHQAMSPEASQPDARRSPLVQLLAQRLAGTPAG